MPDDAPAYIRKAARIIDKANLDKEERDMMDELERAENRYLSTLYTAEKTGREEGWASGLEQGLAKGLEQGEKEKAREIARNALKMKLPIADISTLTGMAEDEIHDLVQERPTVS